jgi:hypothetical protein
MLWIFRHAVFMSLVLGFCIDVVDYFDLFIRIRLAEIGRVELLQRNRVNLRSFGA